METTARRPGIPATTNVLALLCAMYFINYIVRVNVSTAAAVFQPELHLTNTQVGLIFSAFAYPYLAFQIAGGWVADKFGARRALTVFAIIWSSATVLMGLANSLSGLVLGRVLLGIGVSALPVATRAMSNWTPAEKRGFAQGITHTFSRIGNGATALIVAALIAWFSWRESFYLLAPVNLVWLALWFWYFRDSPRQHPAMTPDVLATLPVRASGQGRPSIPWLRLARRIMPVTTVDFCYGWTLWIFQNWIQSYFVQNYGLDTSTASFYSASVLFAGVIGDTLGGVASDLVLHRTGSLVLARRSVIAVGFLGGALFMIPVVLVHDLTVSAVSLGLAFLFAELIVGPIWAVPMDIAPRYAGTASGMMNFGFGLAGIVSPVFFGTMIDLTGTWTVPFTVSIALLLLGAVLTLRLRPDLPFLEEEPAGLKASGREISEPRRA